MIFGVVKKAMGIRPLRNGAPRGYQVNLSAAVPWVAREARCFHNHKSSTPTNKKTCELAVHFNCTRHEISEINFIVIK